MAPAYQDYYEALGVPRDATQQQIQSAYRKLARKYHPDVNKAKGAEDKFKRIGEAFEVLGDPNKRKKYDKLGTEMHGGDDFTPPPGWEQFRRGGYTGRFSDSGFSDFFESLFGNERTTSGSAGEDRRSAGDQEADITITLEEAFRGGKKKVTFEELVPTSNGRIRKKTKRLEMAIPPGVHDGSTVRLAGQGARRGGRAGDLYVTLHIQPHPRFRVSGSHLEVDLALSPWEALFGSRVELPVVGGKAAITIPPATQSGKRLRLKGRGLRKSRDERGDLFAVVRIVVPPNPSDEERRLFAELARISRFAPRA